MQTIKLVTPRKSQAAATLLLALMSALLGCRSYVLVPEEIPSLPVQIAPSAGRRALSPPPISRKFRVAVLDFIDNTNSASDVAKAIPVELKVALVKSKRFDVYDKGQHREKSSEGATSIVNELIKEGQIDAALLGYINRPNNDLTLSVELMSAYTNEIMMSDKFPLDASGKMDDSFIPTISGKITGAVPPVENARVMVRNGEEVTIDAGSGKGVHKWMSAFVLAKAEGFEDPTESRHADAPNDRRIIAEIYVTAVEENRSYARIRRIDKGSWIERDDIIQFK